MQVAVGFRTRVEDSGRRAGSKVVLQPLFFSREVVLLLCADFFEPVTEEGPV